MTNENERSEEWEMVDAEASVSDLVELDATEQDEENVDHTHADHFHDSPEEGIARDVGDITECVREIIGSTHTLFELKRRECAFPNQPNTVQIEIADDLAGSVLKCLQIDLERITNEYPAIGKYNPYFGMFSRAMMHEVEFEGGVASFATVAREEWLCWKRRDCWPDRALTLFVDCLNGAIAEIRRAGDSEAFKNWKKAFVRQPRKNESTLWSLVLACLNVNHHIQVLRFDLAYAEYYCSRELAGEQAISYEDVRNHRVALRRYLKHELKKKLRPGACKGMGLAIKFEYGLDKTHHFHVIVILNGDVVGEGMSVTEMICDHWKRVITGGKGLTYNCNKATYPECGIGSVRYDSKEKLRVLKTVVVPYVTKPDFYGDMVKPDNHRAFWVSQPPKIEARRRGRKRSKTDALKLLVGFKPAEGERE